jgi:hypothetical protein
LRGIKHLDVGDEKSVFLNKPSVPNHAFSDGSDQILSQRSDG